MYPEYLFIIYTLIIVLLIFIYSKNDKKDIKFTVKAYILIIYTILMAFILNLLSTSSFGGARTHLPIGMVIGIAFIYLYAEGNVFEKNNLINTIIKGIMIVYIFIIICNYENLILLQKKLNNLENLEMKQIVEYIGEYEEKNDKNITKIYKVLYKNESYKQFYKELPQIPFLSSVIRSSEFADKVLNVYLNRNLESKLFGEDSTKVKEYINIDKNEKGYECIDNTLYISVYAY